MSILRSKLSDKKTNFICEQYDDAFKSKANAFFKSVGWVGIAGKIIDNRTGEYTTTDDLLYEKAGFEWTDEEVYHFNKYNAALNDDIQKYIGELN